MTDKQKKLISLLREMFQLDRSDLDFGIYKIMNAKASEINEFLEKDLINSIKEVFSSNGNDSLEKELNELISNITNAGMNPDDSPKVQELREKLSSTSSTQENENEIYSHLSNFFSRYYKDGDFVSLRRYKKDTYAVPYEGEEVKLHWANSDQYYIKTSENFRDYSFNTKTHTVHFKLKEAETSTNNNKSDKRVFVYQSHEEISGELFIYFTYEDGKNHVFPTDIDLKKYSLDLLMPTPKNKTRTLLEKHLTDYTAKNSFDYFIHKDLKGFLTRELDFFIKNEILYIDDILESSTSKIESSLSKVKTFKTIAQKIIAFLSQLEEFQKKLWLKKKFVIDTNYCITLDRIPQKYHEEIFGNQAQLEEWQRLFDTTQKSDYLVVDTKFFDADFKNRLLSEFDDIDEECDGVLINSENFGALNLLQDRYKEQIKTVYIDPPYNTGNDGFMYSDNFQHSSWMSFMFDRLALGRELISDDGVIFSSMDDNELEILKQITNLVFYRNNFITDLIRKTKSTTGDAKTGVNIQHENCLVYAKNKINSTFYGAEKDLSNYKNPDNDPRGGWVSSDPSAKSGNDTMIFNIINPYTKRIDCPPKGRYWAFSQNTIQSHIDSGKIIFKKDYKENERGFIYKRYKSELQTSKEILNSLDFIENKYMNQNATKSLLNLGLSNFIYPKGCNFVKKIILHGSVENSTILDFFAGSGTTGHAVINLNREDGGKRKYILVEMGEYFDSVTKPRIQKVIYTDNWKDGKPQDTNGISQMFKYFRLESYEDTLNNLAFKNVDKGLFGSDVHEDYLLNYMLDYETNESLLNIDAFKTPFDYKLKIATSSAGETVETKVDLVETFNYLIGLKVEQRRKEKGYLWIRGENLKEEKILVIWRDFDKLEISLEEFIETKQWDIEKRDDIDFDVVYINGDNNLANLKKDEDHFKVKLIEEEFRLRMFNV